MWGREGGTYCKYVRRKRRGKQVRDRHGGAIASVVVADASLVEYMDIRTSEFV